MAGISTGVCNEGIGMVAVGDENGYLYSVCINYE